jgi:glycosyltransferase involved in cell wall biosynthesis
MTARVDVLQVITDTDRRGPQVFSLELERALVERGWSVRTVALAPGVAGGGLPVPNLGAGRSRPGTLVTLAREASRARVVLGHGSTTLPVCAAATAASPARFIHRNLGEPMFWANTPWRRTRTRLLLTRPDVVVALWEGAARELVGKLGVGRRRVRIIPRGASGARFAPADASERSELKVEFRLDPARQVVAFVGSLSREKDPAAAVRAVAELPNVQLLVAGHGPERPRVEALARDLAPGRVRFLGAIVRTDRVFRAADAVVLPSRTEGIPAALVEAGLSAVPAVASAVGGVPDVVLDGVTGRLVEPGDAAGLVEALREVLGDSGAMGEKARAHCLERFELDTVADQWDGLLREVLA